MTQVVSDMDNKKWKDHRKESWAVDKTDPIQATMKELNPFNIYIKLKGSQT